MTDAEIASAIMKRRKQCIVHRILYYVFAESLIEDLLYDRMERELKALVTAHPDVNNQLTEYLWCCPTQCVGADNESAYPAPLVNLAKSLLAYANREKAK